VPVSTGVRLISAGQVAMQDPVQLLVPSLSLTKA